MAQSKNTTNFEGLLFQFMDSPDPMLSMLERLNKEIRRRTRVVGIFPNPDSYLRLVTVYLMEYSEDWSVTRGYLSEDSLKSLEHFNNGCMSKDKETILHLHNDSQYMTGNLISRV